MRDGTIRAEDIARYSAGYAESLGFSTRVVQADHVEVRRHGRVCGVWRFPVIGDRVVYTDPSSTQSRPGTVVEVDDRFDYARVLPHGGLAEIELGWGDLRYAVSE